MNHFRILSIIIALTVCAGQVKAQKAAQRIPSRKGSRIGAPEKKMLSG